MTQIVPPKPDEIDSYGLQSWHVVNKIPWDVLVGLSYVEGATLSLHTGQVNALAAAAGEVSLDDTDSTRDERELDVAGEAIWVVSTSSSDTTDVAVVGVNGIGDCETKVVTLNGTTPVSVPSEDVSNFWFNVNRIVNAGTVAYVGNVYCSTKSDAGTPANTDDIQCFMAIGTGYASNPMVMAGNNEALVFDGIDVTTALRDEVALFISRRIANTKPWIRAFKIFAFEAFLPYRFIVPIVITQGQKICFSGLATTNNTDLTWQSSYYSLLQDSANVTVGVGRLFE